MTPRHDEPSVTHEHQRSSDSLSLRIGGETIKKILAWLLAGSIGTGTATGAWSLKSHYDDQIAKIRESQQLTDLKVEKIDGKLDTVVKLLRKR